MSKPEADQNHIQMPPIEAFRDAEAYYATLLHETTHYTRHPSRLDRDFGRKRFGDEGYAMEELVAELDSAFLSADLDLTPEARDDHAAYIASWIKVLPLRNCALGLLRPRCAATSSLAQPPAALSCGASSGRIRV